MKHLILSFVPYIQIFEKHSLRLFFSRILLYSVMCNGQGYLQGHCLLPSLLKWKARAFQESQDGFVAKDLPVEVAASAKYLRMRL